MNQKLFNDSGIKMKPGKLQAIIIILVCFLLAHQLYAEEIKNTGKPAKGESTFDIKKVWEINTAGEDPFGNIENILISAKGHLCCYDNKNMKYYLFDGNGKFIYAFGTRGEGPGEIKQPEEAPILNAGNKIVVQRAAQGQAPDDLIRSLAKQLPNEETYFSLIEEHNGLIYLYVWKFFMKNTQQIDIFSPWGEYLYKKIIKVEPKYKISCMPVIDKNYVYLGLEDEDGEITLNKYEITLPKG